MLVMSERFRRRRARRDADETELMFVAYAAAQGGKDAFRQMQRMVKDLRRASRGRTKRQGIAGLAEAMGLKPR